MPSKPGMFGMRFESIMRGKADAILPVYTEHFCSHHQSCGREQLAAWSLLV